LQKINIYAIIINTNTALKGVKMTYPVVTVEELPAELAAAGASALGMRGVGKGFVLTWNGNKVPRGAVIDGYTVGYTKDGLVTTKSGLPIARYVRIAEFEGPERDLHVLHVFMIPRPAAS
jgi:hypothetical protein